MCFYFYFNKLSILLFIIALNSEKQRQHRTDLHQLRNFLDPALALRILECLKRTLMKLFKQLFRNNAYLNYKTYFLIFLKQLV